MPASISPERLAVMRGYCGPWIDLELVPFDGATGLLDLDALRAALGDGTACVYVENPGYLGTIETQAAQIASLAHDAGALLVVGVDPVSLGVLEAPPRYGADIVCGELQPLGVHMHYGGGLAGFVATPDEERWVAEYPTFLIGMTPTVVEGEYGFGEVAWERMSYVQRGDAKEYGGTTQNLWAIAVAVYLSLLGPQGIAELGRGCMQRARYAAARLSALPGVEAPALSGPVFKELVVSFTGTGKTAAEINERLLEHGIYGGKDLSGEFPELGESALYCFTEVHAQADIDRLVDDARGGAGMSENGGVLRPFHQASWNEPIVLEQSSPGERGILLPEPEPDVAAAGDGLADLPAELRRTDPPGLPGALAAAGAAALPAPLAGDARHRRRHPPRAQARAR